MIRKLPPTAITGRFTYIMSVESICSPLLGLEDDGKSILRNVVTFKVLKLKKMKDTF
jgi:hypothetical protein